MSRRSKASKCSRYDEGRLSYQPFFSSELFKYRKFLVQVLNVSHNAIAFIEGKLFTHFANLKFLDLGNNRITFVPDKTFSPMSLLLSIKLNNNSLLSMDDAVLSELKLSHLDLSCNRLSNDNFLWPSAGIAYLNLTFNAFKEVNVSVLRDVETDLWGEHPALPFFRSHSSIEALLFAGNPFSCEWLVKEVLASKNIRLGRDYILDSQHNVMKVAGIRCFDESGANEQKLIVLEADPQMNDDVG